MASQAYKILIKAKDNASGAFKKVSGAAKTAGGALAGVAKIAGGVTLGLAAVATTLAVLAKKSFDFADAIGKVSTRTGIATDTIQGFQIASVLAGSTVDAANTSLEKFTRSVGDAVRGLKTQADIFRDLGVEITDVNGNIKDQDTLLREVTQAMSGLTSQSEKATVAANLFGRAGIKILGAIDGLGMGLDDFIETAEQYGLILDRDSIKKSELFNDTLFVLTRQFQILKAEIAIAFLPIFQALTAAFVQSNKDTTSAAGGAKEFAISLRDNLLAGLLNALKGLDSFVEGIIDTRVYFHVFGLQLQNISTAFSILGLNIKFATQMFAGNVEGATQTGKVLEEILAKGYINVTESTKEFMLANEGVSSSLQELITRFESYIEGIDTTDEATQQLLDDLFSVNNVFEQIQNTLTDNLSPLAKLKSELTDTGEITKQFEQIQVNAFNNAANALTEFVETGKLEFRDFVESLIRDIVRLQIRLAMARLFNFGQVDLNALKLNQSIQTATVDGLPTNEGGGYTGMGARAGGLDGKGGFLSILHPQETVLDHTKGQGGVIINQTVSFATGVQDTVRNEVLQLLPDIAESSKGAVFEAMQRGGVFRRGMT